MKPSHLVAPIQDDKVASELDEAFNLYASAVQAIADREFENVVKPYLEKYGMRLNAVNGEWWITYRGEHYYPFAIREKQDVLNLLGRNNDGRQVFKILQTHVPGQHTISLANYMPVELPERRK